MDRLLDVTAGLSVVLLLLVLVSLRRSHIRVEYSVSWLMAAAGLLALSRTRVVLLWVSRFLGVPNLPVALLFIVGSALLIMFFRSSVIISKLRDDNIALAQRVAILEFHINRLNESRPGVTLG